MGARRLIAVTGAVACALALASGCDAASGAAPFRHPALEVTGLTPTSWLSGTRFELTVQGLVPPPIASYRLDVEARGQTLTLPLEAADGVLTGVVPADWLTGFDPPLADLSGAVFVRRTVGDMAEMINVSGEIALVQHLAPELTFIDGGSPIYPGDVVAIGADQLYREEEGEAGYATQLGLDGRRTYEDGTASPLLRWYLDLPGGGAGGRAATSVRVSPDLLGLRPGAFSGQAGIVGFEPRAFGPATATAGLPYDVVIARPYLGGIASPATSRGRWLEVRGRGLLAVDPDAETASVLVFDGVFIPRRGLAEWHIGSEAWVLPVEQVVGNTVGRVALRSQVGEGGGLVGLGARAGRFTGTVTLRDAAGDDVVSSAPVGVDLTIASPRQEVELRVLPGFDEALALFGLTAEREAVLARILAVLERDYAGYDVGFGYAPPPGFAEYAVVELAGSDPNGDHLFALDNTLGKDVGNLRLDDVIGGFNADTRAQSLAAWGGIFPSELINLSPSLATNSLASPRFDDVFAAVMPALGGIGAASGESERQGARGAAIRAAVRVLGNLVGSTITHEVGHTLGLTAIEGRFHNDGDTPGWIMDLGIYRPFEERAELDGAGPAVFSPFNQAYLGGILPPPPQREEE